LSHKVSRKRFSLAAAKIIPFVAAGVGANNGFINHPTRRNDTMMQDWNTQREALLGRVGEYAKLSPDTVRGLGMMDAAGAKTGKLEPKIRELIALAVAVTTRCDGCIAVHTKNAVARGATREEIAEALGVAIALNAGAAMTYTARVLDAHDALTK
jgi:AhpD family alkylhydroperoxidase